MSELLQKLGSTLACLFAVSAACATPASPLNLATGSARDSPHVLFVENAGQWDGNAAFAARMFAGMLFIASNGQLVYRLNGTDPAGGDGARRLESARGKEDRTGLTRMAGWVVIERFVDAENKPVAANAKGMLPQSGRVNYSFARGQFRHLASIRSYERVSLGEVYGGILAEVRAIGGSVEKIFTIAPGADPARI